MPDQPIRILHVDDCSDDRFLVRNRLSRLAPELEFIEMDSAQEALAQISRVNVDCILCDFQMPGMSGLEFLRALRSADSKLPFIFLTGQGNESVAVEAMRAGADDYFTKLEGFAHYDHLLHSIRQLVHVHGEIMQKAEAENALRESEQKFRLLFERSIDALLLLDGDEFVDCNPATLTMLRCETCDQVLSCHPEDFSPPFQPDGQDSRAKAREMIQLAHERGAHRFEWTHRRHDGELFPVEVTLTQVPLGGKQILYVSWRDLTQVKRIDADLRTSERNYQEIFDASTDAIFVHDADTGDVVDINQRTCELFGYTREEILSRGARHLSLGAAPFADADVANWILRAVHEGPQLFEWLSKKKSGETFWVEVSLKLAVIGGVRRVLAFVRSIDQRKQTEERLMFTRFAIDHASDAVYWFDENSRVIYANWEACRQTGYSQEELLKLTLRDLDPDYPEENMMVNVEELRNPGNYHRFESRHRAKDGHRYPVEIGSVYLEFAGKGYICSYVRENSQRKQFEAELREREEQLAGTKNLLQLVLDTIPVRIFWKDLDYRYLGCNRKLAEDAGLTDSSEIIGLTDFDLPWRELASRYQMEDQRVMRSQESLIDFEEPKTRRDGTISWLRTSKFPLMGIDGSVIGVLGIYTDFTETKAAEESRRKLEERFAITAERTGQLLYDYDMKRNTIEWAGAIRQVVGYSPEEFKEFGLAVWDRNIHPDDYDEAFALVKKAEATVGEYRNEYRFRHKAGHYIDIEESGIFLPGEDGKAARMIGILKNVSERKRAEREIKLRSDAIENSLNGFGIVNADGTIAYANQAYLDMWGFERLEEILGTHSSIYNADPENASQIWKHLYEHGSGTFEFRTRRKSGSTFDVMMSAQRSSDIFGREIFMATFIDITRRKQAEAEAQLRNLELDTFFESSLDLISIVDRGGFFRRVNPQWSKTLGHTLDEIQNRPFMEFVHPEDIDKTKTAMASLLDYQEIHNFVNRYRTATGEYRWIEWRTKPKGELIYAIARDVTEQRQELEELKKSDELYQLLFNSNPHPMWVYDLESMAFLAVNEMAVKKYGFNREEFMRMTLADIRPPEDVERLRASVANSPTGIEESGNWRHRTRDGTLIDVEIISHDLEYQGRPARLVLASDVTRRLQAERALRESEERYALTSSRTGQLLYDNDLMSGGIIWAGAIRELTGYSEEEFRQFANEDWEQMIHPDDRQRVIETCERIKREQEKSASICYRFRKSDASYIHIEDESSYFYDENDRAYRCIGIMKDIEERIRAEAALRRSEEQYRFLAENVKDILWSMDRDLKLNFISSSIERFSGFTVDEYLTLPPDRTFSPQSMATIGAMLQQVTAENEQGLLTPETASDRTVEIQFMHKNGALGWGEVTFSIRFDDEGKISGFFGVTRDITERKIAEEEIRLKQEQLIAANEELDSFAHSVSHDLQAPLRRITSLVELIDDSDSQAVSVENKRYLELISRSAVDLRELVQSLLEFSRAKRSDMERLDVDLSGIVGRIVNELRQEYPERSVRLDIQPGVMGKADPQLIYVVLQNLLSNAWKFTGRKENARLQFGCEKLNEETVYFVKDNGAGFDPAHAGKLFQPFTRLHSASEFKGRGIGLSTCSRIISRHGGRIWAESEPEVGASFYFTLPE